MSVAKIVKPTTKNSSAMPLGHAKENKDASVYKANGTSVEAGMAPMKAGVYASEKTVKDAGINDPVPNGVSYGRSGEPKTEGIVTRGNGAATKGLKARGSMA
jgi:hypothetical protein